MNLLRHAVLAFLLSQNCFATETKWTFMGCVRSFQECYNSCANHKYKAAEEEQCPADTLEKYACYCDLNGDEFEIEG